ncbi:hypothetical protein HDU77_010344 [Chytriomyces hyalinus]|nr:hypothetical protein HDU77_010344 [Chytriomyces hyalinus]
MAQETDMVRDDGQPETAAASTAANSAAISNPNTSATTADTQTQGQSLFRDKYISSLEEHCTASDALRTAEKVAHSLEKDVAALRAEIMLLTQICEKNSLHIPPVETDRGYHPKESTISLKRKIPTQDAVLQQIAQKIPAVLGASVPAVQAVPLNLPFELTEPRELLADGTKNVKRVRAWTDIMRCKYPTFKRAAPAMSTATRKFIHDRGDSDMIQSNVGTEELKAMQSSKLHSLASAVQLEPYQPGTALDADPLHLHLHHHSKYLSSMDDRPQFLQKVRLQEARAMALASDAKLLRDELAALKLLCTQFGLLQPTSEVRKNLRNLEEAANKMTAESEAAARLGFGNDPETVPLPSPKQSPQTSQPASDHSLTQRNLQLMPWHTTFRYMYPGELTQMSPQRRQEIDDIVKEFLLENLSSQIPVSQCRVVLGKGGTVAAAGVMDESVKTSYAVPAAYIPALKVWFARKIPELLAGSGRPIVGKINEHHSHFQEIAPVMPERAQATYPQQMPHRFKSNLSYAPAVPLHADNLREPAYAFASEYHTARPLTAEEPVPYKQPLQFPTPLQTRFSDGGFNVDNYRAWTDIIRVNHPTFQRASPPMSKHARLFLQKKSLSLHCVVPGSSIRIGKATFAIPESLHHEFMEYMEAAFLSNGVFGDLNLHSKYPRHIPGGGPVWESVAPDSQTDEAVAAKEEDVISQAEYSNNLSAASNTYETYGQELTAVLTDFLGTTSSKDQAEQLVGDTRSFANHISVKRRDSFMSTSTATTLDRGEMIPSAEDGDEFISAETLSKGPASATPISNGVFPNSEVDWDFSKNSRAAADLIPSTSTLHFPTPCPPYLANGSPNVQQYRAWTDVIRAKHPTFQRASPQMCKQARAFIHTNKIPVISLTPATSLRIGKATFSIPYRLYDKFIQEMDQLFFRDGFFGDKAVNSAAPRRIPGGGPGWDDSAVYPGPLTEANLVESLPEDDHNNDEDDDGGMDERDVTLRVDEAELETDTTNLPCLKRVGSDLEGYDEEVLDSGDVKRQRTESLHLENAAFFSATQDTIGARMFGEPVLAPAV